MPKQVVVIMQENYPFGQCEQITNENTRVLVRKVYEVSVQERGRFLEKAAVLRRLKNEHMIRIDSVLEEEESIHFLFEYIPIKLETWISNINDQFIENFRDQLIKFSAFLANHFIKIEFQLKNIGMDQNYGAKYFLDMDFALDPTLNREKLKSMYIREITNLFKPYIVSSNANALDSERERPSNDRSNDRNDRNNDRNDRNNDRNERPSERAREPPKNTPETRKVHDTSISPPTNRNNSNNNSKNKEKALAQYYQDVNMSVDSENEKILQEFMDVLDNEGEEEVKHQPQMAKPQPQSQQPARNQQPPFAKQSSQPVQPNTYQQANTNYQQGNSNNYQQNSYQPQPHNNSFQQGGSSYQQQQYGQPSSSRQIQSTSDYQPPVYNAQFHSQNSISGLSSQVQTARNNNATQSMGRGKSEIKEPPQIDMWRESADLQNRVKNAIEKSMSVIKKFKAIKENSQL